MIRIKNTEHYTKYSKNGKLHREDGPAVEYDSGYKSYWMNGMRHRFDGPAIEWEDGTKEYWYYGKRLKVNSTEEFIRMINLIILW